MYLEGITFSVLLFVLPLLSIRFYGMFLVSYFFVAVAFALFASWKEQRLELLLVPFPYLILVYINAYVFLEQMLKEVLFRKKSLYWFTPERVEI